MPITPTYPGVYIQEIPSGVRTITGVATSITAFVGRAQRGPANQPVKITSFADFTRIFGGLWRGGTMGYAVRDFYLNGGATAVIVRAIHSGDADATKNAVKAGITLGGGPPNLLAKNEGAWGNQLRARVDHDISVDVATGFGLLPSDLFNLYIRDMATGVTEAFRNVTVKDSPRRIDKVLTNESTLVDTTDSLASVPSANGDPALGKTVWEDNTASTVSDGKGSDGALLVEGDIASDALQTSRQGLYALLNADLFNILCIPPYTSSGDVDTDLMTRAARLCEDRRVILLVDPPSSGWTSANAVRTLLQTQAMSTLVGTNSKNAAMFFPRLNQPDPLKNNQLDIFVPCGAVAGVFARTDAQRGVWKAPAGLDATLSGVPALTVPLNDGDIGLLNPFGVNCLRTLPAAGNVVWGSRTLQGDDRLASEWKYVPVRRTALFIEESLYRGTQWVVFEPNDEPLWAQIRLNIGAFMQTLFRQGAFQGKTPQEAYFVKCDKETTTQTDINNGTVNILVGFAPLKPAEFVIIQIQQIAGEIQT
jgi:phage tail sheath protein FI